MNCLKQQGLLCFIFLMAASVVVAATSPLPMLESVSNNLIQQLQKNKSRLKTNPRLVDHLVQRLVLPKVDKYAMARSVAPRQEWVKASSKQQQQFVQQFQTLVMRTYAAAFTEYTNEKVKFIAPRGNLAKRSRVQVQSMIIRSGKPSIAVTYSLARMGKHWKIYDFSVEGVSMVQSFRSQLAGLNTGHLSGLTRFLKKHNQKNAAKK